MKIARILLLLSALALFAAGGCGVGGEAGDADVEISSSSETSSSSDENSESDPGPTDTNYSNYDAVIPEGFPDVIPIYDIENSTVMGGIEQDAGRTMMYSLVLGSNDQISDVTDVIVGSLENIDMNSAVEGSTLLIGYMGNWDYTITVDNGEADGFTSVITYSLTEKQ